METPTPQGAPPANVDATGSRASSIPPTSQGTPPANVDVTLQLRLEAARVAQERTRLAFFATTLIALAILIGVWNAYLSSYRAFAIQHHTSIPKEDEAPGAKKLQQELLAQWVQSRFITISLIGVHVGIGDAPLLGGIALLVSSVWFYLSIRRENFNIGRIILDFRQCDNSTLWHIYYSFNSYTIFTRVVHSDAPIGNMNEDKSTKNEEIPLLARGHSFISFLYYLPVIATAMALLPTIRFLVSLHPFLPVGVSPPGSRSSFGSNYWFKLLDKKIQMKNTSYGCGGRLH